MWHITKVNTAGFYITTMYTLHTSPPQKVCAIMACALSPSFLSLLWYHDRNHSHPCKKTSKSLAWGLCVVWSLWYSMALWYHKILTMVPTGYPDACTLPFGIWAALGPLSLIFCPPATDSPSSPLIAWPSVYHPQLVSDPSWSMVDVTASLSLWYSWRWRYPPCSRPFHLGEALFLSLVFTF